MDSEALVRGVQQHTVSGTLRHGSLASTAADTDTVDDIALLGLVAETARLVGARGTRGAVDDVQLAVLPAPAPL